jgi:glycosyltransferase involved in cell wall biosynthesis
MIPQAPFSPSERVRSVEFFSSVEYASFQQALMQELEVSGWKACQRFEVAQQAYWNTSSRLARWYLQMQSYVFYPIRVATRFAFKGRTVGVVCTNTFFAPWVAEVASGHKGIPIVHWVFDLFPDVLVLTGRVRAGSLVERVLRRCVRATFDNAAANVFLGARMRAFAEARFGYIPRSVVIPVGCDARRFRDFPPTARSSAAPVRVLYCGNLGRMHDVMTFIQASQDGLPAGIEFEFRGGGAAFRELKEALRRGSRVRMAGHLPEDEWATAMQAADVALVTMRPGAEGLVMPSKTYSALAAGQAVLAICPRASDLADTVMTHDCGWVVEPGDSAGLWRVFEQMICSPEDILRKRRNAWDAGQKIFDQRILAKQWVTVLESVLQK